MPAIINEAGELRRLWGGFWASRVLLTANNYRIFDHLTKPQSANTIAKKLKTDLRATEILLDALTGIGLLKKNKDAYLNTAIASGFLVRGKLHYQGDILRHADILWQNWSGLDEVLKTGSPYRAAHDHEAFIMGMHNLASLRVKAVIRKMGLRGVKTALDLGGGPGTYSIEMAKKGMNVTLFDRPETVEIARRIIDRTGVKNIRLISGDFIANNIGSGYDLIFASHILHSLSEEDCILLTEKCKNALNKAGRIAIQEFYITKNRTQPAHSALFSINMLINTEGGRCYSPVEMKGWLAKAGFKNPKWELIGDAVLMQAVK